MLPWLHPELRRCQPRGYRTAPGGAQGGPGHTINFHHAQGVRHLVNFVGRATAEAFGGHSHPWHQASAAEVVRHHLARVLLAEVMHGASFLGGVACLQKFLIAHRPFCHNIELEDTGKKWTRQGCVPEGVDQGGKLTLGQSPGIL